MNNKENRARSKLTALGMYTVFGLMPRSSVISSYLIQVSLAINLEIYCSIEKPLNVNR